MKCRPKRWVFILLTICITSARAQQGKPDIILIMADDMGYSDIGCYGGEIPTPNIDRLAAKGVRFRQFYNTARCCPTRASLMTGLFPHQTGIGHMTEDPGSRNAENWGTPGYQGFLNDRCVTIAEALKEDGYHTYMTGKWHLGFHGEQKWPLQRGFEKYYGILAGAANYFRPQGGRGLTYNNTKLQAPEGNYYTTDAFTDSAISFIRSRRDNKPYFLYLAFNAPHWPLQARQEDIEKFKDMYDVGWDVIRQRRFERQRAMGIVHRNAQLSPRDPSARAWADLSKTEQQESAFRMAVYAAQVYRMDQNIGKLLQYLDESGRADNTLVIFLSDNGACAEPYKELGGGKMEDINDPGKYGVISYGAGWANASNTPYRKWKRNMEEGGISTPFIVRWPQGIAHKDEGRMTDEACYLPDVMPTLLEAAGAGYPSTYKGKAIQPLVGSSMLPVLAGKATTPHEYMYWEHEGSQAIRKGSWKAVKDRGNDQWQLFDLHADRTEQHDQAGRQPALLQELIAKWREWAHTHAVLPKRNNNK